MKGFRLLLVAALGLTGACGPAPLADAPDPSPAAGSERASSSAPSRSVDRLLGEWGAQPPASEARLLDMARAALSAEITEDEIAALGFSAEEEHKVRAVRRLRETEPSSPIVLDMRRKLAQIEAIRVTFTPEKLISTTGTSTSVEAYVVEEDLGERVLLLVEGHKPIDQRRYMVRFVDADHIVIHIGQSVVPFARIGARPAATPPSERSSARSVDAPRTSRPASGGAASAGDFDTCVRTYLRRMEECMARLPPSAQSATREALEVTKRLIRISSETAEGRASFAASCDRIVEGPAFDAFCSL
jgi:hypothetical protein